ncbi:uncharacterized protein LOC135121773 isoform X2 [Zophobas morio]|uniref:uncharacterized protein LOC135121773 isoform X2 n=1 Tax=Zophobas morio TaxID=2755281 RepID=UPI0030831382
MVKKKKRPQKYYTGTDTVEKLLLKMSPVATTTARAIDFYGPTVQDSFLFLSRCFEYLLPYHPEGLFFILFALFLLFFGGHFPALLATFETFRMIGFQKVRTNLLTFSENYHAAWQASALDDLADENNDGILDVKQISRQELTTRKLRIFFKAVDPRKLSEALFFFYCSFLAVIATLRARLAITVTMGASLGESIERCTKPALQQALESVLPQEYHKWIPVIVKFTSRCTGVALAAPFFRIGHALHSSLKGGLLLADALVVHARTAESGSGSPPEDQFLLTLFGLMAALIGFLWQYSTGFRIPVFLRVLVFPLEIAEYVLYSFAAYDLQRAMKK